ncbi:hypothetical protein DPMN_052041 [Dreissena polymorpha]|uniref:Uncharacterized protein n=1 Tax=Dreissena polymorpha TaxID=45954 RepID=A0A9D4CIY7_DREPO|nr:hypothetical protein DPMN_052041 [Dreissena polymorpha]
MSNELLFAHAYPGIDSTERIFGSRSRLSEMQYVPIMKLFASSFLLPNKSQEEISNLGNCMMVDLFGGKPNDSLESLRHNIFTKKVATAKTIFIS